MDKNKLEFYEINYFANGIDVPYKLRKGENLSIKPILVKDFLRYDYAKEILLISKNEINDIKIIQESYLDFLINDICKKDKDQLDLLYIILHLCLGLEYMSIGKDNGRTCIAVCDKDNKVKQIIYSKEFDDIKDIILHQNDINYDDRYVNPEVREVMEEYYRVKYKDIVSPSFEKRKAFVSSKTGLITKQLNEMPYREFDMIYHASVDSEIYIGQKIIQASEKYEVKGGVSHPLFTPDKDPYSEIFDDTTVLNNKGISGTESLGNINK